MSYSILFVDDESDMLSSMGRILRREGYSVETAASIADAMNRDNWSEYFAIILDRKLPDGTIDNVIPELKRLAPQAAMIVITAYADLQSSLLSLRSGVEDYLLKPIEPEVVLHRLRRVREMHEAKEQARQSERLAAIGQTMAGIAHESRNSLQKIQAAAEMLELEVGNNQEAVSEIRRIEAATDSLRLLLEEVREFAAPIKLDIDRCDVAGIWRRAWLDVTSVEPDIEAEFKEDVSVTDFTCRIDGFRVQQVFRNLFENAISAAVDSAQVTVICAASHIGGEEALEIRIRDRGTGFAEETRERVFDAFFTSKPTGTGLGMAIVKRIVEAHGGRITIGPNLNPGAEVIVTLPRKRPRD